MRKQDIGRKKKNENTKKKAATKTKQNKIKTR